MQRQAIGGWSICIKCPHDIPYPLNTCFNEAFKSVVGTGYEIILYLGSQVVTGTNYLLLCKQTTITNPVTEKLVYVVINKPLTGPCTIVSVKDIA